MNLHRDTTAALDLGDVLGRVLDRGIVVDAMVRVAVSGIDIVTIEARVVVASIETYVQHAGLLHQAALLSSSIAPAARPQAR
jgi:hypothetical protein